MEPKATLTPSRLRRPKLGCPYAHSRATIAPIAWRVLLSLAVCLILVFVAGTGLASSLNETYFDGYLGQSDEPEWADAVGYTYGGQIQERDFAFGPMVMAGFYDHTRTQLIAYARGVKHAQLYHPNQVGREYCRVQSPGSWRVTCQFFKYGGSDSRLGPSHYEFNYYFNRQTPPGGGTTLYWNGTTGSGWRDGPQQGYIFGGRVCTNSNCDADQLLPLRIESRSPKSQGNHLMFYAETPFSQTLGNYDLQLYHPNVVGWSRCRHNIANRDYYIRCQHYRNG